MTVLVAVLFAGAVASAQTPDPGLVERAKALLRSAPFIDTHNDLPTMLLEEHRGDISKVDLGQVQPALCADVPRLPRAGWAPSTGRSTCRRPR